MGNLGRCMRAGPLLALAASAVAAAQQPELPLLEQVLVALPPPALRGLAADTLGRLQGMDEL
jgi:hypothetical protein